MSKLRSDELVNMEGDGAPSFPQSATTIEPTADNQVATKSYVDLALSAASGNLVSDTAPTNPALGSFWTDTSVSPSILKTWNGSMWIEFAGEGTPYTGFLGSPVEVLSPVDGAGVGGPSNYTAKTSQIASETVELYDGRVSHTDMGFSSSHMSPRSFAKGNGTLIVCSTGYGIKYSQDNGATWGGAATPTNYITSVIWTGQNFLASSREVPFILYSPDGINWTGSSVPGQPYSSYFDIQNFAYSPTLDRVVATNQASSNASPMLYSDDHGVTWGNANNPSGLNQSDRRMSQVEWGNGRFVATGYQNDKYPIYSTNGTSWTMANSRIDNYAIMTLIFNPDNNTFYGMAAYGYMFQSSNGSSWSSTRPLAGVGTIESNGNSFFAYDNGVYYVIVQEGSGRLVYTTDFSNWNRMSISTSNSDRANAITMIDGDLYVMGIGSSYPGLILYRNRRSEGFGAQVHQQNSYQPRKKQILTFVNNNVYDNADNSIVADADFATVFSGTLKNDRTGESFSAEVGDGTLTYVTPYGGNELSMYALAQDGEADTIRTNNQITKYGPSPSDIVFTSQNANTAPVSATDATVAFRKWTLETRASSSDPWTLVVESDDYDIVASQDGATPWSASPTLQPNTSYRVKVSYHSANAETIESNYNTFETGPS